MLVTSSLFYLQHLLSMVLSGSTGNRDTWSTLGLAPLEGEEVTVYNTGISLLLPIERR